MRCEIIWYLHKLGSINYGNQSILRSVDVHCTYQSGFSY
uniref:Uncharacterized protein n=1 Tax=Setaria italica TaxID=4555 RepID=K4A4H7_SETIT